MAELPFDLLNRHLDVSRETFERLSLYHDLLLKWQPKINLVGPKTIDDSWARHFLDSLQLVQCIEPAGPIVDVGSGAGFPGMALAIYGLPDVHLIESDGRKITFLKEVARITKCPVSIHHKRIEEGDPLQATTIVSRALSELSKLLSLVSSYVSHETTCLFHKGKNYSKEVSDAGEMWTFDHTIIPSITDPQGVILKLTNIRKRGI